MKNIRIEKLTNLYQIGTGHKINNKSKTSVNLDKINFRKGLPEEIIENNDLICGVISYFLDEMDFNKREPFLHNRYNECSFIFNKKHYNINFFVSLNSENNE